LTESLLLLLLLLLLIMPIIYFNKEFKFRGSPQSIPVAARAKM